MALERLISYLDRKEMLEHLAANYKLSEVN
jgi:hypothetical protein